jgi:hypothetical protein
LVHCHRISDLQGFWAGMADFLRIRCLVVHPWECPKSFRRCRCGCRAGRGYAEHPTATLQAKAKLGGQTYAVKMQIRTRDQFSDTSAVNLAHGRVSGLAILYGALKSMGEIQITLVPLLIGAGGSNLYPEKYP